MDLHGPRSLLLLAPHVAACNRTTHSDVVCVTVTLKPAEAPPPPSKHASKWTSAVSHHTHTPASLPSSLSHAKRCELLIQERDEFMRTLQLERNARQRAEAYASTKIQVRGHAGARRGSPLCAHMYIFTRLLGVRARRGPPWP